MIWSPPRCGEAILLFPEFFARKNRQKYTGIFSAVVVPYTHWIRECIHEDILREFLENHRMEARAMSIFEYDQEKHMRQEREAAWKAGIEEGRRSGIEEGRRSGLEEGRRSGIEEGRTQGEEQLLTLQIRKKLAKGKDVAVIAAELEETEERIRELIKKIKEC